LAKSTKRKTKVQNAIRSEESVVAAINSPDFGDGVNVDLGLAARVRYERKRLTTEHIPEDVTRARAGAWLTLISPLTEWAGLRGDRLRYQRELLRIQQEATLTRIAELAVGKHGPLKVPDKPLPNKFIVPFLEKAALEDPDSPLVDLWASLLVSASTGYRSEHLHFSDLIHRMSVEQARILQRMVNRAPDYDELFGQYEEIDEIYTKSDVIRFLSWYLTKSRKYYPHPKTEDDLQNFLIEAFDIWCISICEISLHSSAAKRYIPVSPNYAVYHHTEQVDHEILQALGILTKITAESVDCDYAGEHEWSLDVAFYRITSLGLHFVEACKMQPEGGASTVGQTNHDEPF
jgi:hypothetical protein